MAEPTIYAVGVALIIASVGTFYYLRGASKEYLDERRQSTYDAIKKLESTTDNVKDFFTGYETVHEEYAKFSENAEAYRRLASAFLVSGLAVVGFNFIWDSLVQLFGQSTASLFALLIAVLIWYAYLNGTWSGVQEVHRIKPRGFTFKRRPKDEDKLITQKPETMRSKGSEPQEGERITVTLQLPTARWGEPKSVKVEVEQSKTVGDLVSKAMKETGVPPDIGPIFVVAGQVILGPQDFGKPIMTSGIQPNQTVILTDKPPIQPKVVGSPYYIPPYAEGTLVHIAEARSIARTWVQAQKPTLELRAFTDKVNESETFIQVRGTFADQYMLSHEFDVRISRADGKTLEGSYVT